MSKIRLYCPVRERPDIFSAALDSHHRLAGVAESWYYDDNDDPATSLMLRDERKVPQAALPGSEVYERTDAHHWTTTLMSKMAVLRNHLIRHFLNSDAEAMLLVDSDVIMHPDTAKALDSRGREIVSAVYWTRWFPSQPYLPNVWDVHNYLFTSKDSLVRLREADTYRVGGLGACTLMSREIFDWGVNYKPVAGSPFPGEDRHFCIRAAAHDFELHADTHFPPFHVYRPEQLDEARQWVKDGCHPGYFRKHWLNAEWESKIRGAFAQKAA